jgi:hypothetical protein
VQEEEDMKRFAKALALTLGSVALGSFVLLVPQSNAAAQSGPVVTLAGPLPLPVKGNVNVGNFPSTLTGSSVPVSGNVTASVNLPNPLPVQPVKQSAANFKTLLFNGSNYIEVLPDGTSGASPFTIPQGDQFVITDVSWVAFCFEFSTPACVASAGDAVVVELGNGFYVGEATYSSRFGSLFAGHNDHLTSGIVASQLPGPTILGGGPGEQLLVILQGYLVP